jgi:ribosomal protein L30E
MIYLEATSVKELYDALGKFDNVHSIQILREGAKFVCIAQDEPIKVLIEHEWASKLGDDIPVWVMGGSDMDPVPVTIKN